MKTDNKGGPSFPCEVIGFDEHGEYRLPWQGMDLRDYFAAKAMQATMQAWISTSQYPSTDMDVAVNAYAVADAMLEARSA